MINIMIICYLIVAYFAIAFFVITYIYYDEFSRCSDFGYKEFIEDILIALFWPLSIVTVCILVVRGFIKRKNKK